MRREGGQVKEGGGASSIYKILYVCLINGKINKKSGSMPPNLLTFAPYQLAMDVFWFYRPSLISSSASEVISAQLTCEGLQLSCLTS